MAMDLTNLSSNWKKLQATLKKAEKPSSSSSSTPRQHGLKRKRAPVNDTLSAHPIDEARKRQRIGRTMQTIDDRTGPHTIQEVENRDNGIRPRFTDGARFDKINAGLSPVYVATCLDLISIFRTALSTNSSPSVEIGRYIAIDCEMVGVGPNPDKESALARVSIVNYNGEQVYDSYVRPLETVTDWRTPFSGITPKNIRHARSLEEVQTEVAKIMQDRVLIGHSVRNDLEALLLSHPKKDIRDTARHPPHRKLAGGGSPKLKILASELLGLEIQIGDHSSIEDARACMLLFRRDKAGFEREHTKVWPTHTTASENATNGATNSPGKRRKQKKKKKKK